MKGDLLMDKTLYELAMESKKNNEAIEKVLNVFKPKIKKTLLQTSIQNREDLEQELQIKLVNLIRSYDLDGVVGFWGFYEQVKNKVS